MRKKIKNLINLYYEFKNPFSFIIIFFLFFFTFLSIVNFHYDKNYIVFISIFLLIFIISFWLILLSYAQYKPRKYILNLISMRNRILRVKNLNGAEIGVLKGDYSSQIIKHFKTENIKLQLYLIDPWVVNDDFTDYEENNLKNYYKHVKKKFFNHKNVKIIKKASSVASEDFITDFFDFIYIDGNHDYKYVKEDLELWFPKLKNKGILFGDDYLRPYGVSKAVAEFAFANNLIVHFSDGGSQFYLIKD